MGESSETVTGQEGYWAWSDAQASTHCNDGMYTPECDNSICLIQTCAQTVEFTRNGSILQLIQNDVD